MMQLSDLNERLTFMPVKKVLTQIHPQIGIDTDSMLFLQELLIIYLSKFCANVKDEYKSCTNKEDVKSMLESALQKTMGGEPAKYGIKEAEKSLTKYDNNNNKSDDSIVLEEKAGLLFIVDKTKIFMEARVLEPDEPKPPEEVSTMSAIYTTATVEYISAEILELAGNEAKDESGYDDNDDDDDDDDDDNDSDSDEKFEHIIKVSHIIKAIEKDSELSQMHDDCGKYQLSKNKIAG